ncbi:MAG TPA: hemerythrin domain-containing protein [Vicinamibacteria bacterium]|nr:hemerythrin domain-containing protein [Vicinamibacteria bacterium]
MDPSRRRWLAAALAAGASPALAGTQAPAASRPIGDEGVGPGEDLMREHGVLNRILLVYDEGIRRIRSGAPPPLDEIRHAAGLVKRFLEEYHEKLEEEHLFPRFERAGKLADLVGVLRAQHLAGRRVTAAVLTLAVPGAGGKDAAALADQLGRFVRMYRPHEAREDTVLFPAFRELVTREEYERLGEDFESREEKALGHEGFEHVVEEVSAIEKTLGIFDLASFTPAT